MRTIICCTMTMMLLFCYGVDKGRADSSTLGEQDFNDGDELSSSTYLGAQVGEPIPFRDYLIQDPPEIPPPYTGFIGLDGDYGLTDTYRASWTHDDYTVTGTIDSAEITFGIWEHDSEAAGDQVLQFLLDDVDLTVAANLALNGHGGSPGVPFVKFPEYNIYTIQIPGTALSDLEDGSTTFTLELMNGFNPNPGVSTSDNGAAVDFSTLSFNTTAPIPEPTVVAGLAGLLVMGLIRPRRYRARA